MLVTGKSVCLFFGPVSVTLSQCQGYRGTNPSYCQTSIGLCFHMDFIMISGLATCCRLRCSPCVNIISCIIWILCLYLKRTLPDRDSKSDSDTETLERDAFRFTYDLLTENLRIESLMQCTTKIKKRKEKNSLGKEKRQTI